MSQLVIASNDAAPGYTPGAQVAHDLRNLLATVALHLEALQRLSGPSGTKAADAAQAPLTRGAALCNKALDCTANADNRARPRGVDLIHVARHVADLLLASTPKNFFGRLSRRGGVAAAGLRPQQDLKRAYSWLPIAAAGRRQAPELSAGTCVHDSVRAASPRPFVRN